MITPRNSETPVVLYSARSLKVEEKTLEFHFHINELTFTYPGTYYLRFAVQSLFNEDVSGVHVKTKQNEKFIPDYQIKTEILGPVKEDEITTLVKQDLYFHLPVGFCKNDKDHDVYLQAEVYRINPDTAKGELVGQARLGIYPRAATEMNFLVEMNEPIYIMEKNLSILRMDHQDNLQKHISLVKYKAILRETFPLDFQERPQPKKVKYTEPLRQMSPAKPKEKELILRAPPSARIHKELRAPKEQKEKTNEDVQNYWRLLSLPGQEEISIILHGATHILSNRLLSHQPTMPHLMRNPACVYVLGKTKSDEDQVREAQDVSTATEIATSEPGWEEVIHVKTNSYAAQNEVLILTIAEAKNQTAICEYRLPWTHLEPFHHYHLDLTLPIEGEVHDSHLYVSLVRKISELHHNIPEHQYAALVATLENIEEEQKSVAKPMIAISSIIADYKTYGLTRNNMKRTLSLAFQPISFPSPSKSDFRVGHFSLQGQSQVSYPSRSLLHPFWNFPFMFCDPQELSTMFTRNSGIVIEFYPVQDLRGVTWSVESPIAHCCIPLDKNLYRILSGRCQAHRLSVPIHGELKGNENKAIHANIVLQMFRDKTFEFDIEQLKYLDNENVTKNEKEKEKENVKSLPIQEEYQYDYSIRRKPNEDLYWLPQKQVKKSKWKMQQMLRDEGTLPPHNAMESILPEYQYSFHKPKPPTNALPQKLLTRPSLPQYPAYYQQNPQNVQHQARQARQTISGTTTLTSNNIEVQDYYSTQSSYNEVERYRQAIRQMGLDIKSLKNRVHDEEMENARLRRRLQQTSDKDWTSQPRQLPKESNRPYDNALDLNDDYFQLPSLVKKPGRQRKNYSSEAELDPHPKWILGKDFYKL